MTNFDQLYYAYRELRRDETGWLRTDMVSSETKKLSEYRRKLSEYRTRFTEETLTDILRNLSDRFMDEYSKQSR
jgi:hypothetical protein